MKPEPTASTDTFLVERSTVIAAAPATVHALINDFHKWELWSPWDKIDTDLKRTYGGAPSGVGATYAWEGRKTGAGAMEIIHSDPALIQIRLNFTKPMKTQNLTVFAIEEEAAGTKVLWSMTGANTWMSKIMGLFFSMDKMVGGQFAQGLADLKRVAEAK